MTAQTRRLLALALVASMGGCTSGKGPVEPTPDPPVTPPVTPPVVPPPPVWPRVASDDLVGGARLKARWYVGPDGNGFTPPWVEAPFFDQLRGATCLPRIAADGLIRCVPEISWSPVGSPGHPWAWADAACSEGVVSLSSCGSLPAAMSVLDDTSCPTRLQFRALGAQVAAASQLYVRDAAGTCVLGGSAGSATYRLGAEVPPSTFVAAVQVEGETRGGFTEVLLQWEDGARQARGLRPDGQGQYGWPMRAADGAIRLLPTLTDADLLWWFSDSTCTAPAAMSLASSCTAAGPTALEFFQDAASCEDRNRVYPVGARLTQAFQFGGICQPAIAPGLAFWEVGAELSATSFPSLSAQVVTDRIAPQRFAAGTDWSWRGGWSLPQAIDHDLGVAVRPLLAVDGQERWLPYPTAASSSATQAGSADWYFSDPACTLRVLSVNLPATCTVTSPYIAITSAGAACGAPTYQVFALGPQVTGTIYRRTGPSGSCSALGSSGRYHQLGAELPAASFAPVTRELR